MAFHKTLKSVVRGLAESFASTMNYVDDDYVMGHIVRAAWSTGAREFRTDLLTGLSDPSPLLVPPVMRSLAARAGQLQGLLKSSNSDPAFVSVAELLVTVDPSVRRRNGQFRLSPFTCTVRIVDDRGQEYSHKISDWWTPEVPTIPIKDYRDPHG
jgi:hypothetical protein